MDARALRYQMEALTLLRELDGHGEVRSAAEGAGRTRGHVSGDYAVKSNAARTRTVAERARASMFSRLVEILSQIIAIEQELMRSLSDGLRKFLRRKDNIDLKNICLRMALGEAGYQSDKDLRELRVCLQLIVSGLLSSVRDENASLSSGAVGRLADISITFPDV